MSASVVAPATATAATTTAATAATAAAAARIDQLVDGLRERPAGSLDDATFCRRAYLDVVGRIPSLDELRAFLDDGHAGKRDALIEELLASPGHRSHRANLWADLLRQKDKLTRYVSGEPLRHWIRQELERQTPYDEMVRELLVAEGPAHAPGNGASGHLMRDAGMLEDSMANTVRAFLGARIECAQCHDHPFEPWTQEQYFGMVAFTGGLEHKLELADLPGGEQLIALRQELVGEYGKQGKRAFTRAVRPLTLGLDGSGTAEVEMPADALRRPGEPVRAATFTGHELGPDPRRKTKTKGRGKRRREVSVGKPLEVGSRAALADWVVSNDQGLFARTIANRVWAQLMGRGVIEPLDDVWSQPARDDALMAELERLMLELDYDLDAFRRVVLSTKAWRAPALPARDPAAGLTAPALRRLSAEQLWDSLVTLVVPELDAALGPALTPGAEEVYAAYEAAAADPLGVVRARFEAQVLKATDRDAFQAGKREERAEDRAARSAAKRSVRDATRDVRKQLKRAERKGDDARAAELRAELAAALESAGMTPPTRAERRDLFRASELEQPAPPDHLLARFGQSDRERLDNGHQDDAVPQVLALLNGFVEQELLADDDAALMTTLAAEAEPDRRLDAAWQAVLGRLPTADERGLWRGDLEATPTVATHDLVWCLLNTHEFLFTP